MKKITSINPKTLRQPTKSYSQGLLVPLGDAEMLFVTGQVAQDIDGDVVAPNDAEAQTKIIYARISDILTDAGMSIDDVVKAQIFLTNIADGPTVSKVRDQVFKVAKPVSTLVEVRNLVKPGCCVEIEVIAVKLKG